MAGFKKASTWWGESHTDSTRLVKPTTLRMKDEAFWFEFFGMMRLGKWYRQTFLSRKPKNSAMFQPPNRSTPSANEGWQLELGRKDPQDIDEHVASPAIPKLR